MRSSPRSGSSLQLRLCASWSRPAMSACIVPPGVWFALSGYAALILVIAPLVGTQLASLEPSDSRRTASAISFRRLQRSHLLGVAGAVSTLLHAAANSAAHRRVLILAIICISDAGFSRFVSLFLPAPTTFPGTYLFYEGGNLFLIVLMFLWDWKRNRIMKQFLWGASLVIAMGLAATRASTSTRHGKRSRSRGCRRGAAHAVKKPRVLMQGRTRQSAGLQEGLF